MQQIVCLFENLYVCCSNIILKSFASNYTYPTLSHTKLQPRQVLYDSDNCMCSSGGDYKLFASIW